MRLYFMWSLLFLLCHCTDKDKSQTPQSVEIKDNKIAISSDSAFLKYLQIVPVKNGGHQPVLQEVGEVIAVLDKGVLPDSPELVVSKWKYFNTDSSETKLIEHINKSEFTILIRAHISKNLSDFLTEKQVVLVSRYGTKNEQVKAQIVQSKHEKNSDLTEVIIGISSNLGWSLGAICDLKFQSHELPSFRIPTKSLLHLKDDEYVLVEETDKQFALKHVSVFAEEDNEILVMGDLKESQNIIGKGAILLKNLSLELLPSNH